MGIHMNSKQLDAGWEVKNSRGGSETDFRPELKTSVHKSDT